MQVIFTDLDGTLLDEHDHSFEAAQPALDLIAGLGIPLIFCTSKTRAEVEGVRDRLANRHPFIVENGGAAFVPKGYFPFPWPVSREVGDYDVMEFGERHPDLVEALQRASAESHCRVRGFHEMTVAEVGTRCRLSPAEAAAAKQREYDEPFEVLDAGLTGDLLKAIAALGKRWTRGDAFYHITGNSDKAQAVQALAGLYRRVYGQISTLGLGDALNDAAFLNAVDLPFLIRSRFTVQLKKAVPQGCVTQVGGPQGWKGAVLASFRQAPPDF